MCIITFTNLPQGNDFGTKTVKVKYKGIEKDSAQITTLFPKCAWNNPWQSFPNWYFYWGLGNVCGIDGTVYYEDTIGYGKYNYTQDRVYLLILAPGILDGPHSYTCTELDKTVTVGGEGWGPYCVAQIITHERHHQYMYKHFGTLETDTDKDRIPDNYESTFDGIESLINDPDSYDMGEWLAGDHGDEEIRCYKIEMNPTVPVNTSEDWSDPGVHSDPPSPPADPW
jgi:hypothetical protein